MKKMLFVMNPYSGTRKANQYLPEIISLFNQAGFDVTVRMTSGPQDAAAVVERLAGESDVVVCCGGDGTFNETVTGVLRSGVDAPIGYIPAGSTNDFAASLKLSTNIMQAAQDIVEGVPNRYDVGKFGDRYFSYVASFGAFTKASYTTPQSVKNVLGHTAYVLEGIQELSQIRREHLRLELNGEVIEDDFIFGAISNSTSVGGILTLDPSRVDMADGKLEVLLVRMPKDLLELSECIRAVKAMDYNNCATISFRSAEKIRVFADPEMLWTLDGEREEGHEMVEVENVHNAIRILQKEK